jgi:membrane dipeptidase
MEDYQQIHKESIVVDTHCDTLKTLIPMFTRPRDSQWDDRSDVGMGVRSSLGHVDIPRLREGGVDCQIFAISSERSRLPSYPLRTALEMIDRFYIECEKNPDFIAPVKCYDDVLKAKKDGRVAAMLSIEGADVIEGKADLLRIFHRLGVRMVGLVHSIRNLLADGVADRRSKGGLSVLGVEAVELMERLGVIIDVSHLNDEGYWDLVEMTQKPFIASHSNARTICGHPRNMDDDMIRALAERGGVMGMNFAPNFVHPTNATVERMVDHIDYIVELVGPDHIGLGSDFDGIPFTPSGLEDVTKMPNITKELVKRDYSLDDIKKVLGENHLRLFRKVLG